MGSFHTLFILRGPSSFKLQASSFPFERENGSIFISRSTFTRIRSTGTRSSCSSRLSQSPQDQGCRLASRSPATTRVSIELEAPELACRTVKVRFALARPREPPKASRFFEGLNICQSHQSLSTIPWRSQNTGSTIRVALRAKVKVFNLTHHLQSRTGHRILRALRQQRR
jgi:hypothetical protein